MTVIHIILIIGLVYIATQQNKSSTRNVILFVTGLLVICMASKEGFQLTLDQPNPSVPGTDIMRGWPVPDDVSLTPAPEYAHQITDDDTNTKFFFHFQATGGQPIIVDGSPVDSEAINCEKNNIPGVVGYNASQTNFSAANLSRATEPKITNYLTCTTPFNVDDLLEDLRDDVIDDESVLAQAQAEIQARTQAQAQALAQMQAQTPPPALGAGTPNPGDTTMPPQTPPQTPAQVAQTAAEADAQARADAAAEERADAADQAQAEAVASAVAQGRAEAMAEMRAQEVIDADCGDHNVFDFKYDPNSEEGAFRTDGQRCCNHTVHPDDNYWLSNKCT
jgi:hypothetical protein